MCVRACKPKSTDVCMCVYVCICCLSCISFNQTNSFIMCVFNASVRFWQQSQCSSSAWRLSSDPHLREQVWWNRPSPSHLQQVRQLTWSYQSLIMIGRFISVQVFYFCGRFLSTEAGSLEECVHLSLLSVCHSCGESECFHWDKSGWKIWHKC